MLFLLNGMINGRAGKHGLAKFEFHLLTLIFILLVASAVTGMTQIAQAYGISKRPVPEFLMLVSQYDWIARASVIAMALLTLVAITKYLLTMFRAEPIT